MPKKSNHIVRLSSHLAARSPGPALGSLEDKARRAYAWLAPHLRRRHKLRKVAWVSGSTNYGTAAAARPVGAPGKARETPAARIATDGPHSGDRVAVGRSRGSHGRFLNPAMAINAIGALETPTKLQPELQMSRSESGMLRHVIDFDGGRTRARTLDPLIKSSKRAPRCRF